jgi:capsule biosynthesis phosphatase
MGHEKRIVFDIDGTVSFCLDRDFANAKPNTPLIQKLNKFYDDGWYIILCTSRGNISCDGDLVKRIEKYHDLITDWMAKNGVKYHELSFQKQYADYYVDDKALTPEQFISLEIETIQGGWSGAKVERRNDKIHKTHHRVMNEATWYNYAKGFLNVPKVYGIDGGTIVMEFLEESKDYSISYKSLQILHKIVFYKDIIPLSTSKDYHSKIAKRVMDIKESIGYDFSFILDYFHDSFVARLFEESTFCHGDLTVENTIMCRDGLYFIDPILEYDSWSHYILDISKLLYSLERDGYGVTYNSIKELCFQKFPFTNKQYLFFELIHWIRVFYYVKSEKKREFFLENIKKKHELLARITS